MLIQNIICNIMQLDFQSGRAFCKGKFGMKRSPHSIPDIHLIATLAKITFRFINRKLI